MVHPFSGSTPHPDPRDTITVGVSGPDALLSTLPALIGFHPTESVVLVCVTGSRDRVGPVVRVDLPTTPQNTAAAVAVLADIAAQHADRLILAVYTDTHDQFDTAAVATALARVRPVIDVLTTGNAPRPVHTEVSAALALRGRGVLTDRDALARSVAHDPRVGAPGALLAEFTDTHGRDALISRLVPDPDAVAQLVGLIQATPDTDPRVPDVCAALAILAYRYGDGALARVAVDRSRRIDPDHRLTELIDQLITVGVPPAALDDLLTL